MAALASQLRRNSLSVTNITARSNSQKTTKEEEEEEEEGNTEASSSSDDELANYWSDPEDSAFNTNKQSDVRVKSQDDPQSKPKFTLWSDSELVTNH